MGRGLRYTADTDIEKMGAGARRQIERALKGPVAQVPQDLPKKRKRPEQDEGRALCEWAALYKFPAPWDPSERICLAHYMCHVPNGGGRSKIEAAIFKGQGVMKGYPDYVIDIPVPGFAGMRIELKEPHGQAPDPEQLEVLRRLEKAGYRVAIAWGFEDAKNAIERYLAHAG